MQDQAQRLRELVNQKRQERPASRIITVTSGKGGVGKSFFSVNLAIALNMRGVRVLVIDADFGLANIDIMLGTVSSHNFKSVLSGEKTLLEIIQEGHSGVKFISGGNGIYDLLNMDETKLTKLLDSMSDLNEVADIIILDTGAGINDSILQLISASSEVIVVTTPEPTSLVDAYALIKTVVESRYKQTIHLVMNRSQTKKEADNAIGSLSMVVSKNLGINLSPLGSITSDPDISKTISMFTPLLVKYPKSAAAKDIGAITDKLIETGIKDMDRQPKNNISRFFSGLLK